MFEDIEEFYLDLSFGDTLAYIFVGFNIIDAND